MKYSFRIGSLFGIPLELHITFVLLMAFVFIFSYPDLYPLLLMVLLFVSVVAHEISHSVVARHYGIGVRKIILYPIGGTSQIEDIPDKPRVEWRMAISGPLTSLAIGTALLTLSLTPSTLSSLWTFLLNQNPTGNVLFDLGGLNLFLALFNLIPAFPMDGGRVLRALLAERMKFSDATRDAAFIGRILGMGMVVFGGLSNLWLMIIGFFIYVGASEENESTLVSTTIAQISVKDVMYTEVAFAKPETTLFEALEIMFRARYHDILIVEGDIFKGIVAWKEIIKIKPEQRKELVLGQLPSKLISIYPDESVLEAYKIMQREKLDLLAVVSREEPSKVIGAVTNEGIAFAYQKARTM